MTIGEAQKLAEQLTDITVKFWDADSQAKKTELQDTYNRLRSDIISAGYKIRRSRVFDSTYNRRIIRYTVKAIPGGSIFEYYNPRPTNLKISGDCTTRCIAYCTGEDYMKIHAEQLTASAEIGMIWRHNKVWSKSLESRGFKKLVIDKRMTRATFIKKYSSKITSGIIATRSSGHIAAIDMAKKKVVDSWDSTGGRILMLYVHSSQYDEVVKALYSQFLTVLSMIYAQMKKTVKRFAVHKRGTEQLGYLCSFKDEAEALLADLKSNIFSMPQTDLEKYQVVEVEVSWEEDEVN